MVSHLVQVNEPTTTMKSIPSYSSTSLSNVDDGVVIIVPTLPENKIAPSIYPRPGSTYNCDFDKSTGNYIH